MKEVGRIYSAVDADELEVGDIVLAENTLYSFERTTDGLPMELQGVYSSNHRHRFCVGDVGYGLAKLVCPKKHAEVYKAWKNGAEVERSNFRDGDWAWEADTEPDWDEDEQYRICVEADKDLYAELKKAYAEGKTIQFKCDGNTWMDWPRPAWDCEPEAYRIKPECDLYKESNRACIGCTEDCKHSTEQRKRRMTNRELAKWLAQGNGEFRTEFTYARSYYSYDDTLSSDELCPADTQIRAWDEEEWHEPLVNDLQEELSYIDELMEEE